MFITQLKYNIDNATLKYVRLLDICDSLLVSGWDLIIKHYPAAM